MYMSRRFLKGSGWLLSLLLVGLALTGCSAVQTGKEGNKSETGQVVGNSQGSVNSEVKVVTDLVGREVKVKIPAQDIDPVKKSEEIYSFLLGKPVYDQMSKDYGGFKKLDLTHP